MSHKSILLQSLSNNLRLMKIFGVYPHDGWSVFSYTLYAYLFWITCSVPTPTLALVKFAMAEKNIQTFCEMIFSVSEIGITIFKYLPLKNHPLDIKRTVEYRLNLKIFNEYDEDQEKTIIKDACRVSKILLPSFGFMCGGTFLSWVVREFLQGRRALPVDIYLPFDLDSADDWVFVIVYSILFIGVSNTAWDNAAIDSLTSSLMYHATAQIKILKDNLQHLIAKAENTMGKLYNNVDLSKEERLNLLNRIVYDKICACVKHHQEIRLFVTDIERTYSFVFFSQICASIIVICTSCLQLTMVEPFTVNFFAMIFFVVTMLSQVFLYCYFGTLLQDESNTIIDAIYSGDWVDLEPKSKKALMVIIENSKRPLSITSGTILPLTLDSFVMIVKRSYSLLAMLNNFK